MKQIIQGWTEIYHTALYWWSYLQMGYSDYYTWEFFTSLNHICNSPVYKMYLSAKDYDCLMERLDKPGKYDERLANILKRKAPWDENDD